jgi:hypothetical protein
MFFGSILTITIIFELHVMQGTYGFGSNVLFRPYGYPWGTGQVITDSCFWNSMNAPTCNFLNYNELLYISLFSALLGTTLPALAHSGSLRVTKFEQAYWRSIDSHKDIEEANRELEFFKETPIRTDQSQENTVTRLVAPELTQIHKGLSFDSLS